MGASPLTCRSQSETRGGISRERLVSVDAKLSLSTPLGRRRARRAHPTKRVTVAESSSVALAKEDTAYDRFTVFSLLPFSFQFCSLRLVCG